MLGEDAGLSDARRDHAAARERERSGGGANVLRLDQVC